MVIHIFQCERCGKPCRVYRHISQAPPRFCSKACLKRVPGDVFAYADTSGGPDACWPFQGGLFTNGYGQFILGRAHRVAWEVINGPIPRGFQLRHTCDNPPCINPSHLILGTGLDNARDCIERRRRPRGEQINMSKLTEEEVRQIFQRGRQGELGHRLAWEFGVTPRTIYLILNRHTWKHVTDSFLEMDPLLDGLEI